MIIWYANQFYKFLSIMDFGLNFTNLQLFRLFSSQLSKPSEFSMVFHTNLASLIKTLLPTVLHQLDSKDKMLLLREIVLEEKKVLKCKCKT